MGLTLMLAAVPLSWVGPLRLIDQAAGQRCPQGCTRKSQGGDMKAFYAVLILLALASRLAAESHPFDGSQPADPPRFSVGWKVQWSDGSVGWIVDRAQWQPT